MHGLLLLAAAAWYGIDLSRHLKQHARSDPARLHACTPARLPARLHAAYRNATMMSGKVAVVTGSTVGIGYAIAERMCAEGAKVVITSRRQVSLVCCGHLVLSVLCLC